LRLEPCPGCRRACEGFRPDLGLRNSEPRPSWPVASPWWAERLDARSWGYPLSASPIVHTPTRWRELPHQHITRSHPGDRAALKRWLSPRHATTSSGSWKICRCTAPVSAPLTATVEPNLHSAATPSGRQRGFRNFSTKLSTGSGGCCVEKSRGSIASRQKLPSATNIRTARAIWAAG
jgi:hypothetical protein